MVTEFMKVMVKSRMRDLVILGDRVHESHGEEENERFGDTW